MPVARSARRSADKMICQQASFLPSKQPKTTVLNAYSMHKPAKSYVHQLNTGIFTGIPCAIHSWLLTTVPAPFCPWFFFACKTSQGIRSHVPFSCAGAAKAIMDVFTIVGGTQSGARGNAGGAATWRLRGQIQSLSACVLLSAPSNSRSQT